MPIATRPHEVEGNPQGRRSLRSIPDFKRPDFKGPDFKRSKGNGNGNYVRNNNNGGNNNRTAPPEATNAENFYYLKQMNSRTPMVIVMTDGEQIHGWIEWYDKTCLKVNREGAPNLLIQKHCIKYVFKQEELSPES
ncbi:MAG TPA: RNA chaperone Hfq [Thermoanaerobaculia bacterium]|nr:RNA chaperone Hfq [Thermoanaerobaculia bacterium]